MPDHSPEALIREVRARHIDSSEYTCYFCGERWPCDTKRIADALEAALREKRAAMERVRDECIELGEIHGQPMGSLVALRNLNLDALENQKP